MSELFDPQVVDRQVEFRGELTDRAKDVLGRDALMVVEYGSTGQAPKRDLYSDVDLWVVVPDGTEEEIIENRDEIYHEIGGPHVKYERPRFAPIDGMHSIVMFPGPVVQQEVDISIVPARHNHHYESFLTDKPGDPSDHYPWREGEESCAPADKLSYLLCVSFWTMKYALRGDESRVDWLLRRFDEVRQFVPALGDPCQEWQDSSRIIEAVSGVIARVESVVSEGGALPAETLRNFKVIPSMGVAALTLSNEQ